MSIPGLEVARWLISLISDFFMRLLLTVLVAGPIPQHIAFVMDGNRRYARTHHKLVQDGHTEGFHTLHRTLDVCLGLNIRCVSVYAFSIENFKRSKDEVESLMSLAKEKLVKMGQKGDILDRHGVKLNIVGRRELLPPDLQEIALQVETMTKYNKSAILNICMPYTSRDEMASAVQLSVQDCKDDFISAEDIAECDIEKSLQTCLRWSPPLDVLVRTSGTSRLSDFFLWQASEKCTDTLHPHLLA